MSYRNYVIPMTAGELVNLPTSGRYVRPLKAIGELTLYLDGTEAGMIAQGIGVTIPEGVRSIGILSRTAQTVTLAVSSLPVDDGRITFDSVISTTQANRSLEGNQFFQPLDKAGSGLGIPLYVFENPQGSGVSVSISSLSLQFAGGNVFVRSGSGAAPVVSSENIVTPANKIAGGAPPSGLVVHEGYGFVFSGTSVIATSTDSGGTPVSVNMFDKPLVLPENSWLSVAGSNSTDQLVGFVEFSMS